MLTPALCTAECFSLIIWKMYRRLCLVHLQWHFKFILLCISIKQIISISVSIIWYFHLFPNLPLFPLIFCRYLSVRTQIVMVLWPTFLHMRSLFAAWLLTLVVSYFTLLMGQWFKKIRIYVGMCSIALEELQILLHMQTYTYCYCIFLSVLLNVKCHTLLNLNLLEISNVSSCYTKVYVSLPICM